MAVSSGGFGCLQARRVNLTSLLLSINPGSSGWPPLFLTSHRDQNCSLSFEACVLLRAPAHTMRTTRMHSRGNAKVKPFPGRQFYNDLPLALTRVTEEELFF
ncbi:unnamed protein product [Scytosiphon promiscuus]